MGGDVKSPGCAVPSFLFFFPSHEITTPRSDLCCPSAPSRSARWNFHQSQNAPLQIKGIEHWKSESGDKLGGLRKWLFVKCAIAIIRVQGMDECYIRPAWDAGTRLKMHGFCFFFFLPLYTQSRSAETLHRQINNGVERRVLWGAAVSSATDVSEPSGLCNKETTTASNSFDLCPWSLAHIPTKELLTVCLKCLMWRKIVIPNSRRLPRSKCPRPASVNRLYYVWFEVLRYW